MTCHAFSHLTFHALMQVDDPQQTLYGSLRDLWAALEVRLAEALPEVVALVGQARDGAREARHRQDHLRDALRDTHDALARSTAERNRAKQATADLQACLPAAASTRTTPSGWVPWGPMLAQGPMQHTTVSVGVAIVIAGISTSPLDFCVCRRCVSSSSAVFISSAATWTPWMSS